MIKIKTAQAWGALTPDGRVYPLAISTKDGRYKQQIVIVHGLTEAEVHDAAELLEKSKDVCEWEYYHDKDCRYYAPKHDNTSCQSFIHSDEVHKFCPSCGRKVKIK